MYARAAARQQEERAELAGRRGSGRAQATAGESKERPMDRPAKAQDGPGRHHRESVAAVR